jgi:hypothetical protein
MSSSYFDSLKFYSDSQRTLTRDIYISVKDTLYVDTLTCARARERDFQVQEELPDDMSANEWRRVRETNIQKAKGSELYRAQSEISERTLSVSSRKIGLKLGKRLMDKDLVAPRHPGDIMTNCPETAKLLGDKDNFEERDPAVDYYREDDEAQPYRSTYNRTPKPEHPRANITWVPPQYETLTEEETNKRRFEAIQDPALAKAYEINVRLFGQETAALLLQKTLDTLNKREIAPAHSLVVPRIS